ncbi:MAG: hypothetical protein CMJ58_06225 [Planctomycetaceae bacterium]|nr:hypothetical protein [Planctomycetaceae bacterium]
MADWPLPPDQLLDDVVDGSPSALGELLQSYRPALLQVAAERLDPRITARLDASDVVQDALVEASPHVGCWLQSGKPLAACLCRLVRDRIARITRDHVAAQKRSVAREAQPCCNESTASMLTLAARLGLTSDTPSRLVGLGESCERLRRRLAQLPMIDQQVLMMRIVEGISARAVGEVLGLSEGAVNMRQLRALRQLRRLLALSP